MVLRDGKVNKNLMPATGVIMAIVVDFFSGTGKAAAKTGLTLG